jgi:hypothetical protein
MSMKQALAPVAVGLCLVGWARYSGRPTKANLRRALRDTFPLI